MRRVAIMVVSASLLVAAGGSWGPGASVAYADDKAEAGRHFKLGVSLYNEQKYKEALVEFQRAYELAPHPSVLYNVAATYRELSFYGESIEFFERFLAEGDKVVKRSLIKQAKKELDELRARVGSLAIEAPEGVAIRIDGREVAQAPLARPLVLGPGDHEIEIRGGDGRSATKTVRVTAGDRSTVALELPPLPEPDPVPIEEPDPGRITDTVVLVAVKPRRPARVGIGASVATNALAIDKTGVPVLGLAVRAGARLTFAVDVTLVAFAVVPSVRFRLLGRRTSLDAILATPISITDAGATDLFVAGAGGLGLRAFVADKVALRADALVSVAGGDHGVTVPIAVGAELWF